MAGVLQHLRSSTLDKRPNPASMVDGQIAINYASGAPGMFFKDSNGALVKVGPVHVGSGAPNAVPASGGTAGNSMGEQWLDTSGGTYVFKIWDGSAWRSEAGEFVNVTGDTMTGALGIIAGSAASPSLFISGDANTGLYSPGADQLAISTNGTGRLFVTSDGTIKTSSHISLAGASAGGARYLALLDETSSYTGSYVLQAGGGSAGFGGAITMYGHSHASYPGSIYLGTSAGSGGSLIFGISNALDPVNEKMRLDSSGRLGLGTSDPGSFNAVLAVQKSQAADAAIVIDNSGTVGASTTSSFIVADGGGTKGWFRRYRDGTGNNGIGFTDALLFEGNIGGTKATRMVIDSSGRVGIGTTGPLCPLNVVGNTFVTGGNYFADTSGGYFFGGFAGFGGGIYGADSGNTARIDAPQTIALRISNSERARIDSSGRLLVGTSSTSASTRLVVQGSSAGSGSPALQHLCFDGATPASGDGLGFLIFGDNAQSQGAWITARRDGGTWSASSKPSRLEFSTTADGASSPTERLRITSDAYVRLASGTGGIQFNGDTAAANALDDYEEGTWTPTLQGSSTAGTSTTGTVKGKYTKIGNYVTANFYIDWTAFSGTGDLRLAGLPFTVSNDQNAGAASTNVALPASTIGIISWAFNNQTYIVFTAYKDGATDANVQCANTGTIFGSVAYYI